MDEDGPNGSLYEMLAKHDQSETKHDIFPCKAAVSYDSANSFAGYFNVIYNKECMLQLFEEYVWPLLNEALEKL
jgi:hypothetical protein